ncbi:hypothetical protein B0H12DRAFT_554197 [Mycena haematopus]|nr:hypothetical protein B0H12DRAFT_554197 [Mycena haematopus]
MENHRYNKGRLAGGACVQEWKSCWLPFHESLFDFIWLGVLSFLHCSALSFVSFLFSSILPFGSCTFSTLLLTTIEPTVPASAEIDAPEAVQRPPAPTAHVVQVPTLTSTRSSRVPLSPTPADADTSVKAMLVPTNPPPHAEETRGVADAACAGSRRGGCSRGGK